MPRKVPIVDLTSRKLQLGCFGAFWLLLCCFGADDKISPGHAPKKAFNCDMAFTDAPKEPKCSFDNPKIVNFGVSERSGGTYGALEPRAKSRQDMAR